VTSRRHQPAAEKGLVRGAGSRRESRAFAAGTLAFGALLWLAGAAPWSLPAVYLAFAAVALPYRAIEFGFTRNAPFLLDFCYVSSRPVPFPPSSDSPSLPLYSCSFVICRCGSFACSRRAQL